MGSSGAIQPVDHTPVLRQAAWIAVVLLAGALFVGLCIARVTSDPPLSALVGSGLVMLGGLYLVFATYRRWPPYREKSLPDPSTPEPAIDLRGSRPTVGAGIPPVSQPPLTSKVVADLSPQSATHSAEEERTRELKAVTTLASSTNDELLAGRDIWERCDDDHTWEPSPNAATEEEADAWKERIKLILPENWLYELRHPPEDPYPAGHPASALCRRMVVDLVVVHRALTSFRQRLRELDPNAEVPEDPPGPWDHY